MTDSVLDMSSESQPAFPPIVPGRVILNGENPFVRLSAAPGEALSTDASLWTVNYSPCGSGRALFIKSELTADQWRIYSDNPEMVRWLQSSVQGMLAPDTASHDIEIIEAVFSQTGDTAGSLSQTACSDTDRITLSWGALLPPLLMAHDQASQLPVRPYGVSVLMIPAQQASVSINGMQAKGQAWPCKYDGQPFSTASLALSESWREAISE